MTAGLVFVIAESRQIRYFVPLLPLASVLIGGAVSACGQESCSRRRSLAGLALGALLLTLVSLQLPWFSGNRAASGRHELNRAAFQVFSSAKERSSYLESTRLGPGGMQLYKFLNNFPASQGILALAPVYQALTDRPVFMAPNSSPSDDLTFKVLDAALTQEKAVNVKLLIQDGRQSHWRIRLPSNWSLPDGVCLLRFWDDQAGVLKEFRPARLETRRTKEFTEICAELESHRRVSQMSFWAHQPASGLQSIQVMARGTEGEAWRLVDAKPELALVPPVDLAEVTESLHRFGVDQVVYSPSGGTGFVERLFEGTPGNEYFRLAGNFNGVKAYTLIR